MKKFTANLLTVIMVASLFTSCSNSIAPNIDETVSVSFEDAVSRDLTVSVSFTPNEYYWKYAAEKTDNTGLNSGATGGYDAEHALPVKANEKGLGSVPGFSQGSWKFMLFAYSDSNYSNLVYSGENASVVLKKGTDNKVRITVNPNTDSIKKGKLIIDSAIYLKPQNGAEINSTQFKKYVTIKKLSDKSIVYDNSTRTSFDLYAGSYLVSLDWQKNGISYATESAVATVYTNNTTIIGNFLREQLTNADLSAELNPDVMNKSVYSTSFNKNNVPANGVEVKNTTTDEEAVADSKVSAIVTSDSAGKVAEDIISQYAGTAGSTDNNTELAFELKVNTKNATASTIEYEIGMNALISVTEGEGESTLIKTYQEPVEGFNDFVEISIQMQTGLTNVSVKHNNVSMGELTETDNGSLVVPEGYENVGAFKYNIDTGKLVIKTKTFSPFTVSYVVPTQYVAEIDGVKYTSLTNAVAAVPKNNTKTTIKLISNASGNGVVVSANQNIVFDLNGCVYNIDGTTVGSSGTETNGFQLLKGSTVEFTNGTITSNKAYLLIQNYCDLTLRNVTLDGSKLAGTTPYTLSNNNGNTLITGNTTIIADSSGYAFDLYYWPSNGYIDGVSVTFDENFTGSVLGDIEYGSDLSGKEKVAEKAKLIIKAGTFDSKFYKGSLTKTGINISGGSFSTDPSAYVADGYNVNEENGRYVVYPGTIVCTSTELQDILTQYTSSGAGDNVVSIVNDLRLADGETWVPASVQGYTGAGVITVNGNGHTIYGLNAPLFAGGFAGNSGIIVNDLTIDGATIDDTYADQGLGGFICSIDSMPKIELNNCHLQNSTITSTGGARVGGLIGWTAGYNNPNDGPVDTYITVTNCSVENCEITAAGSVGAIIGHAGNNPATFHTISGCTVTDNILNSTDDGGWRVGVVVGTANVGQLTITGTTESGNILTQTGKTAPDHSNLYGRLVPGDTGKLTIDGVEITN